MSETNVADAFPILCDGCLGPNKFLRMSKDILGAACKVCGRPYDVFKWRADNDGHIRQTECCQLCAKIKNMCSTCLLDLEFRLPAHIRDAVLEPDEVMRVPTNQANREFLYEQHEKLIASAGKDASDQILALPYGKANPASILERLESRKPYNRKRDTQNICKEYLKGTCPRGSNCPYRHETPLTHKTSDQVLVERFRIENTPRTYTPDGLPPPPPADPTITTLFVGGNDNSIDDNDLVDHFSQFGHVASVRAIPAKACAFVEFMDRSGAENAVMKNWEKCVIRGIPLRIAWARPRVIRPEALMIQEAQAAAEAQNPPPDATKFMKIPPPPAPAAHIPPPPGMYGKRKLYPSQDPKAGAAKMF